MSDNATVPAPTQPNELSAPAKEYETARDALVANLPKSKDFVLPSNYKTVEDYADALLSAQKGFTQARQELAAFKKTQEAAAAKAAAPAPNELAKEGDELSIPVSKPPEIPKSGQPVTQEDWDRWSEVIVESGYELHDNIKTEIKARIPGITDAVISQYVNGLKANESLKFGEAAQLVGGRETLTKILSWAAGVMTKDEAARVSRDLKGPNGNFLLLGLKTQYEQTQAAEAAKAAQKPTRPPAASPSVATAKGGNQLQPFSSTFEQSVALSNPLYGQDPGFRNMVDQRILLSRIHGFGKQI